MLTTTSHMQPIMKYENQQLESLKRSQPVKRHSDSFSVEQLARSKKRNMLESAMQEENSENEPENVIKYVPTRREVDSLVIDNYLFQRVSASTNKDGSIGWRCKEYRRGNKCQSTCRIGPNGEIIRRPGPHSHPAVTDAELVFMKAKADAKKRCRSENNLSVQKIFLQEMGKAIINSGITLTPEDLTKLPKFEANKRCLQIQRKIGAASRMSISSSDNASVVSSNEGSVKDDISAPVSPTVSIKAESHVPKQEPVKPEGEAVVKQPSKPRAGRRKTIHVPMKTEVPAITPSVAETMSESVNGLESEPVVEESEPGEVVRPKAQVKVEESVIKQCKVEYKPMPIKKKGLSSIINGLWEKRSD